MEACRGSASDGHCWCEVTDLSMKENLKTLNIVKIYSMHWVGNSEKPSSAEKQTQKFKYDSRPGD